MRGAAKIVVQKHKTAFKQAEVVLVPAHLKLYLVDDVFYRAVAVGLPPGEHTKVAGERTPARGFHPRHTNTIVPEVNEVVTVRLYSGQANGRKVILLLHLSALEVFD